MIEKRLIDLNGINYSYFVAGKGEPLLLFHGFTGTKNTWKPFINYWSDYFRVIAIDLPGHGDTESPESINRYKIESVVEDIHTFLEKLKIDKAHLLGYSMGGRFALSFAILHPVKVHSLILESSSPGLKSAEARYQRVEQDNKLAQMIEDKGIIHFVNYWENIPLFQSQKRLSKEMQAQIRKERLSQNPKGLANSLRGMGTGVQPSWWNKLDELQFPTYIITGELDEKFCKIGQEMIKKIPKGEILTIFDAGHAVHVEKRDKFGKIVLDILLNEKGGYIIND
ncbi:2-succinyl-6-hydroxy-2,4-cyclohexadiene-1-carboxylate synthase [Pallidibacillus pasinlerensis]|uniref:Putative 2-succinyl-6-hydroxy-2,4-cyclohexadiene-1-carboxylate synthase n=1 Tax=Pallidibacillus pasinlerensis TaxID=2703818 RepID=A0ABX0A2X6_9BACI|nr:2-succinyl-6-hydroxy-2,4-cyclohexadiene-1-carboxylate synthase [Pallidibacillus pasinlerensis]NCU17788.1 2-succinyl-6-hydroxy-2,4-cyclohexadiene-1-carboxylate synthase [Pallidibacillus pasinlerensis]